MTNSEFPVDKWVEWCEATRAYNAAVEVAREAGRRLGDADLAVNEARDRCRAAREALLAAGQQGPEAVHAAKG